MNHKKFIVGLLTASLLTLSAPTAFAVVGYELPTDENTYVITSIEDISEMSPLRFGSFTGTVKEIRQSETDESTRYYYVENEAGEPATIVVTGDTYVLENAEITVGSAITGYYDLNKPMIMIYPPQYSAEVVVAESQDRFVKVDRFNEELVSADNTLKLNIAEDTVIVSENGEAFTGELANRDLIVVYDVSTRSIPAQTTPKKVIVLDEVVEPSFISITETDILVNDVSIADHSAYLPVYTNAQGVVMVPLRAVAENLGLNVEWNNDEKSVKVGDDISFSIGSNKFVKGDTTFELEAGAETSQGRTFVPVSFFTDVLDVVTIVLK